MEIVSIKELNNQNYVIANDFITRVTCGVLGSFSNAVSLVINISENKQVVNLYNNTFNIGVILQDLVKFLEINTENGIVLEDLKNIPIRIFYDGNTGEYLGMGHFMKDKFVYFDELLRIKTSASENSEKEETTQLPEVMEKTSEIPQNASVQNKKKGKK